jgi:hypothetical protein
MPRESEVLRAQCGEDEHQQCDQITRAVLHGYILC